MKDILEHKGFIGSVHFSAPDRVFFGKIEGISDLVTFEGECVKDLEHAFYEAVNDYIEICRSHGKPLQKSYKGSFNIRISPELHRKAVRKALHTGISLNQLVKQALDKEVS